MIQLSYCTFGLTQLDFLSALEAVKKADYAGVELSFHRDQFNPFELSEDDLGAIKKRLEMLHLTPACVATASHFFMPSRPHEPSLMCLDLAGRKRRIDLVKRGIRVARRLGVPLVSCGSGFLREEHVSHPQIDPHELLVDSIQQCLGEIRAGEEITLLIEPEPGMIIETMDEGLALIHQIDSPHFKLHVDICHAYCSEPDYVAALGEAAPQTRYLHVSDAQEGYNLKIIRYSDQQTLDLDFASTLVYFPDTADFLLVDRVHPLYFCDDQPGRKQQKRIEQILADAGVDKSMAYVYYSGLFTGTTPFEDEIFTYLISVPGLSFDVLERARPILIYLRRPDSQTGKSLVEKMVANTLTGIVHFHQIPGEGTLDFASTFQALATHGFSGYGSVELYHHVASWKNALETSYKHLSQFVQPVEAMGIV